MRRYYALTLKTLNMGWVPENSEDLYGRYKVVLARDFAALLEDAKRLYEASALAGAVSQTAMGLMSDAQTHFRERWIQEDINGE